MGLLCSLSRYYVICRLSICVDKLLYLNLIASTWQAKLKVNKCTQDVGLKYSTLKGQRGAEGSSEHTAFAGLVTPVAASVIVLIRLC